MSINPIININQVWLRGKQDSSGEWVYIGAPVEIHPDKIIFKSRHAIQPPVLAKIGKFDLVFDKELKQLYSYGDEEYFYQIEFSSYYQCLSFMFSWCKSLSEKELEHSLKTRKFTKFFNVEDLSTLLGQIDTIEVTDEKWKEFTESFISLWNIQGLELVDTEYDSKIFSCKKDKMGLPDLSISVDQHNRYKLRAWGEVDEDRKQEMYILCYFLEFLLDNSYSLKMNEEEGRVSSPEKHQFRTYKIVGNSAPVVKMRKSIQFHKVNKGNLWIHGPFGSGKTLLAKVISEEFFNSSEHEIHFLFSLYNQQDLIDRLEQTCQNSEKEKVIILDNMHLLEESNEIKVQKLVKLYKNNKYIFISKENTPSYFEGDSITTTALKERGEDLPALVDFLLREICSQKDIPEKELSEVFLKKMKVYKWPGNISELRYFLKGLVEYHYFDNFIDYRNQDYHHQCDPYQKQLFRFEKLKESTDFSAAYWREKILKSA
jgi:hypothetical protein